MTTDPYVGSLYFDTNSGTVQRYGGGGAYSQAFASDSPNTNPTHSYYSSNKNNTTAPAAPSYNQEDLNQLDTQKDQYQRLRQSTGQTLSDGLLQLGESEAGANTRATTTNNRAIRDYKTSEDNSRDSKNQAIRGVDTNARTMSNSLRRIIGMAGGSGASANLAADNAVARNASQSRDGVMSSFGKNEQALQTARGDTEDDFTVLMKSIADSRRTQEQALRAGVIGQEQGLDATLGEIAAARQNLISGSGGTAAAQPFRDSYNQRQTALDALPEQFRNIASRDVSVSQPKLSDYLVDRQALNASKQDGGQEQYSPYKAFLERNREEEQRI